MKIIVQTIQHVRNEYNVEPTTTVGELKGMIKEKQNVAEESNTLIYKTKMLKDSSQTMESLGVKDGDSMVIVIKKDAVPVNKPAQPVPEPVQQPTQQPTQPVQTVPVEPIRNQSQTHQADEPVNIFQQNTTTPQAVEPTEANIMSIMEIGFSRDQAIKALRRANNNTQVAAELLFSGVDLDQIPDEGMQYPRQVRISDLTKEQFIQVVQNQPQLIEPILSALDPGIADLLRANPGTLYDVIRRSEEGGRNASTDDTPQQPQQQQPQQQAPAHGLTAEDNAAIDRLCGLGFDRAQCVQAYIACDKNEQLAANFLLDGY